MNTHPHCLRTLRCSLRPSQSTRWSYWSCKTASPPNKAVLSLSRWSYRPCSLRPMIRPSSLSRPKIKTGSRPWRPWRPWQPWQPSKAEDPQTRLFPVLDSGLAVLAPQKSEHDSGCSKQRSVVRTTIGCTNMTAGVLHDSECTYMTADVRTMRRCTVLGSDVRT